MLDADGANARSLDGLSPREAQEAIADELAPARLAAVADETAAPDETARPDEAEASAGEEEVEECGAAEQSGEDADGAGTDEELEERPAVDMVDGAEAQDDACADAPLDPVAAAAEAAEQLRALEALLFAADEPMSLDEIARRLPASADVAALVETLTQHYENRGVNLSAAGGRHRFITNPAYGHVLREEKTENRRLSRAALETLAIIAYHQPCTRADIEDVRGVAVSKGSLDQLLEIGWVRPKGRRRDAPGRPVLYATTPAFLEHFNLESVRDLPGMADLKAAGLLDARLPPGFAVPSPADAAAEVDGDEAADNGEDAPQFVEDFQPEDAIEE